MRLLFVSHWLLSVSCLLGAYSAFAAGVTVARDAGWAAPLLCWRDAGSKAVTVLQDDINLLYMFCVCFAHAIGFRLV